MSLLESFLKLGKESKVKKISELSKQVIISKRFTNDDGNYLPFTIKAMDEDTLEVLNQKYNKTKIVDGVLVEQFDRVGWQSELLVESVVDPDLKNTDLCKQYGTMDPTQLVRKMLLPGEYLKLLKEVMTLNGYYDDFSNFSKKDEEILEVAKNS